MSDKENSRLKAAAIKYNAKTDNVPYIVGLGQGPIAQNMLKTAVENKIPVVEDGALANLLNKLSVGDEIPEELYKVIAEVLVFVCNMDREYEKKFGFRQDK